MKHDWIPSTLGHGETMCSRCCVTNREAAVLGIADECDMPTPPQLAANDEDDHLNDCVCDDDDDDDSEDDMNCGELPEGGCSLVGTEWCDWSCPYSDGMSRRAKAARP